MGVNFTPQSSEYTALRPFRFWCQKVLPLVYEDSLSYYELLCKVVDYLNNTMQDVNLLINDFIELKNAFEQLQEYVNNYFDNLDVQEEINNKLDEMVEDGTFTRILLKYLPVITPQMFGAKGDGITDDTKAFQLAIDTGRDIYIPMSNGEKYLITDTLECNNQRQGFYSDVLDRFIDSTVDTNDKCGYIIVPVTLEKLFHVTAPHNRFQNLQFLMDTDGEYNYYGTCIEFDRADTGDAEGYVYGCSFSFFDTCIYNKGRGTKIIQNNFNGYTYAIRHSYTYDGTGGTEAQQPEYGDRCLLILNNRFHVGITSFFNDGGLLYGALIENNYDDGGGIFISSNSGMKNCIVSGNASVECVRANWVYLTGGNYIGNIITNNTMNSLSTSASRPNNRFIYVTNVTSFTGNSIINNVLTHCKNTGIVLDCAIDGCNISGNTLMNYDISVGNYCGISAQRGVSYCRICDNIFIPNEDSTTTFAILLGDTVSYSAITDNVAKNSQSRIIGGSYTNTGSRIETHIIPS